MILFCVCFFFWSSLITSQGHKSEKKGEETKELNGVKEEEEEEDDYEEDESSDPDIEEEIQASAQQNGPGA